MEKQLLEGLQRAVLQPEVVEYTLERFEAELKSKLDVMSDELDGLRKRKRELDGEVGRLTEALALGIPGKPPAAIVAAIAAKEREIEGIHEKLLSGGPGSFETRMRGIRQFVMSRLKDICELLRADVPMAKAALRKHVDSIVLHPVEEDGEKTLVASGEWNLLGGYEDFSRNAGGAGGQS